MTTVTVVSVAQYYKRDFYDRNGNVKAYEIRRAAQEFCSKQMEMLR